MPKSEDTVTLAKNVFVHYIYTYISKLPIGSGGTVHQNAYAIVILHQTYFAF